MRHFVRLARHLARWLAGKLGCLRYFGRHFGLLRYFGRHFRFLGIGVGHNVSYPYNVYIMIGSLSTYSNVEFLRNAGADW